MIERRAARKSKTMVATERRPGGYFADPEYMVARVTELFLTGESWVTAENRLMLSRREFNALHDKAVARVQAELDRIKSRYDPLYRGRE